MELSQIKDKISDLSSKEKISYETSRSRGHVTNQILCALCNKFHKVTASKRKEKIGPFCHSCYGKLREKSEEKWMKGKFKFYKLCLTCINAFYDLDLFPHNCTNTNLYTCNNCNLIFDKKVHLINHFKYCSCLKSVSDIKSIHENVSSFAASGITGYNRNVINGNLRSELSISKSKLSNFQSGNKPQSCKICTKSFSRGDVLKMHLRIHKCEKPYICMICKKTFTRSSHLSCHLRIHTGEKPYSCKICKKSFRRSDTLSRHLRSHTGEKPYSCKICKKSFGRSGNLSRHLQIHTGKKPYSCKICKKSFGESGNLSRHLRIHTGEKSYSCKICKKSFGLSENLSLHLQSHTGERPYFCNICKKSFSESSNLSRHLRSHTGEKPYSCKICKKSFSVSSNLSRHCQIHKREK